MISHENRVIGGLVGLAVGDALGAPVEDLTSEEIAREYPTGLGDFVGDHPGEVTDDTEMALLVTRSLLAQGGLDMAHLVGQLVEWALTTRPKLGPSTSRAISLLATGVHWSESGSPTQPSSGVLPRCAPLAMALPMGELAPATIECAEVTHRHPLAVAAAVTQNSLVARLVDGQEWTSALAEVLDNSPHDQAEEIVLQSLRDGTGRDGAVAVLVEATAIVDAAESFEHALIAAVSAGGDTDTRGAITGFLAGARWGRTVIPPRWLDRCPAAIQAVDAGHRLALLRIGPSPQLDDVDGTGQRTPDLADGTRSASD